MRFITLRLCKDCAQEYPKHNFGPCSALAVCDFCWESSLQRLVLASRQLDIPLEYRESIQLIKKYLKLKEIFKLI